MPFDPFGDFETRGYLRNFAGEKDPEVVKRLEHHAFAANVLTALEHLKARLVLGYEHVLETNRILFGSATGEATEKFVVPSLFPGIRMPGAKSPPSDCRRRATS